MKQNNQQDIRQIQEVKKVKNLPPINSPNRNYTKNETNDNKTDIKGILKKQKEIIQIVIKKERKFILDQYDQKAIVLCQFCGGQKCPQQDYLTNKIQPNAIQGLHCNWITQNILAMQRPSNILIQQFNLIQVFKKYNINTILNLQQPGQHPYCGHGIDPLIGFSYDPQIFFNNNIRFENQFWQDMTSTTFQQMMKIMNIFDKSINKNNGKISVHCHAGRGRTLMAICAWLIYFDRMTAQHTINLAVQKRQGVLTRTSQRDFLRNFQKQLSIRWKSFNFSPQLKANSFTEFVQWQNISLLRHQENILNSTSFAHGNILENLRKRIRTQSKQIIWAFIDLNNQQVNPQKWDQHNQHRLNFLKTYIDKKNLRKIQEKEQIRIITSLLEDYYQTIPFTPISLHAIDLLRNELKVQDSILKKQSEKRKIHIQNLNNKILKRWDDILLQREKDNNTILKNQKTQIQSPQKSKIEQNNLQLKLESAQNFHKNNNQNQSLKQNESQISSYYLRVLTQPSIVHEFGVISICTLLDFIKFTKQLIESYHQNYNQQKQQNIQILQKCLLTKFSIFLQSKKKYFPLLFKGTNNRQSKLYKKIDKIQKYTNSNIEYLANYMKNIMKQIPLEQNEYKKIIFKLKKVQTNVDYFSKSHSSTAGKFFSINEAKKVYDKARID